MASIGESGKIKIYVVRSTNTKPTNINQFIDYTSFFTKWKVQHLLNNLALFKGTAQANMDGASPSGSGTRKDDLRRDNFIYILAGDGTDALISKFIITKPVYDSDYSVNITAIQSSGSEAALKSLYSRNIPATKFKDEPISTIFEGTGSLKGITIDPAAAEIITVGSIADSTHRFSLTLDFENRIGALSKACNITRKEWVITHGDNSGVTPFSGGDEIHILNRIGDSSSVKTFYLSGNNQNAKPSSGTEEIESVANDIIAKGRDISGNQTQVEVYDGATTKTYVTQTIDGWLANDISAITGTFSLQPGHGLAGLGDIIVMIDNEFLLGSVTGDAFTTTTRGSSTTYTVGTDTVPTPHKAGSDVILIEDVSISIFGSSRITIHVNDETQITPTVGTTIFVGNEKMGFVSKSAGEFIAERIGALGFVGWSTYYAHSAPGGVGSDVFSGTIYPYAPETSAGNSIYDNGLITKEMTDNSCLTKDSLEKKAKYMLDNKKNPIERIALSVADPMDVLTTPVKIGDEINLQNTDSINIAAGDYRVVEYEFSGPFPQLIFYINDPDIRGWTTGQYDFAQDLDEQETIKQQEPTRSADDQRVAYNPLSTDPLNSFSPGPTSIQNVVVPIAAWGAINPSTYLTNSYDSAAANVGFVRAKVAAAAGYWTLVGSDLRPTGSYDIESNGGVGSGESVGTSARPWDYGYFGIVSCVSSCIVSSGWRFIGSLGDLYLQDVSGTPVYFMTWRPATGGSIPDQIRCDAIFKNYDAAGDVVGLGVGHEGLMYFNTATSKLRIYDGSTWADVGGSGAGLWETSASGIRPTVSGYDVLPNGTADLGKGGTGWDDLFVSSIYPSSGTGDIQMTSSGVAISNIRDGSGYGISFDTSSNTPAWRIYGGTQNLIVTRLAGSGVFQVSNDAVIEGNVYPDIAGVYALGQPSFYYDTLHTEKVVLYNVASITTGQPLTITSGSGDTVITGYAGIQLALGTSGGVFVGPNVSTLRPNTDYGATLGTSSFRWKTLYLRNGVTDGDAYPLISVYRRSGGHLGNFYTEHGLLYWDGDLGVTGDLDVWQNVSKGGGSFTIDHPLDPENKLLQHSFIESPEMRTLYYGQAQLDNGVAVVTLPDWWHSLNGKEKREFNYQLTPIGEFAELYISKEIEDGEFEISGDKDVLVSWQVTAIRHDKFAENNRIEVEVDKEIPGRYKHPRLYVNKANSITSEAVII